MKEDSNALAPPPSKDEILALITAFFRDTLGADYDVQKAQKKLADYARNAWQMKEVTHIAKYSHPDAKAKVKQFALHVRIWPEITSRLSARACEPVDNEGLVGLRDEWG